MDRVKRGAGVPGDQRFVRINCTRSRPITRYEGRLVGCISQTSRASGCREPASSSPASQQSPSGRLLSRRTRSQYHGSVRHDPVPSPGEYRSFQSANAKALSKFWFSCGRQHGHNYPRRLELTWILERQKPPNWNIAPPNANEDPPQLAR